VALLPHDARPDGWALLAVPDRAIRDLASHFPGRCVHLSGSLDLPGVPCAHPLTSFDGEARDWRDTPLAITGEVPGFILGAFADLGFRSFSLQAEQKALYHACAVLASGHAASLWLGAAMLLAEAGIALPGRGLASLAEATVRNIAAKGRGGLTGPFARGDEATILRDAEALPSHWREVFLSLGRLGQKATPPEGSRTE
jgi:hypothetical protein